MEGSLIPAFLKKVRAEKNLTQEEMAKLLGVSYRTYQRVEAEQSHLSAAYFLRLLKKVDDTFFLSFLSSLRGLSEPKDFSSHNLKGIFEKAPAQQVEERAGFDNIKDFETLVNGWHGEVTVGYWEWNIVDDTLYWSDELYSIYGIEKGGDISPPAVSAKIFKDDLAGIESGISLLIEHNIPYVNQHRVHHAQGECVVNGSAIIVQDEGKPIILGSVKSYIVPKKG